MMHNKLSSTSSILKQLPKEKIYNNIKTPMDIIKKKESVNTDLNSQIHNFQKEPNTNFMSSLQNRYPVNSQFQIQKPVDYGLTKELIPKGKFSLENSGITSSLLNKRIPNNGSFKTNNTGIPTLNKEFSKYVPNNLDYRYVDPQTYEYKLKGLTLDKMIKNKMQEEGVDDPTINDPNVELTPAEKMKRIREQEALEETLPATVQYKRWREKEVGNKVSKIQKLFRGHSDRENLRATPFDDSPQLEQDDSSNEITSKSDVIKAGKLKRTRQSKAAYGELVDRKNEENQRKEWERRDDIQREIESKFETFLLENDKLNQKQALQLFAKTHPNYKKYLSEGEMKSLLKANEYDSRKFTDKQKALHKLQNIKNPEIKKMVEEDLNKKLDKFATTIQNKVRKRASKIDNQIAAIANLRDTRKLDETVANKSIQKFEHRKRVNKVLADHKIEELGEKAGKRKDDYIEPSGEEKELVIENPHNTRSKTQANTVAKLLNKQTTKEEIGEAQPAFIDKEEEEEEEKPPIKLTAPEQASMERKFKRIDSEIKSLESKIQLVNAGISKINELDKSNSQGRAPTNLRKQIKEIYDSHGMSFNANLNINKIYKQLQSWEESDNRGIQKYETSKEKFIDDLIKKRGADNKKTPSKNEQETEKPPTPNKDDEYDTQVRIVGGGRSRGGRGGRGGGGRN
jgi:hypothetical protein